MFTVLGGDASLDNYVDVTDLGILANAYDLPGSYRFTQGDYSGEGVVNVTDLGVLATNYQVHNLRYLILGDLDNDDDVDDADRTAWNSSGTAYSIHDVNKDGVVNSADSSIIDAQNTRDLAFMWIGS